MIPKIAALLTAFFLANGALGQDVTPERVEYLASLASSLYRQHERYLALYHRGLALTTYGEDHERSSFFALNWFPVELGDSFRITCTIQCNNDSEKAILRNFIISRFQGHSDGFIDHVDIEHGDDREQFCINSQSTINYLFRIVGSRAEELVNMRRSQ